MTSSDLYLPFPTLGAFPAVRDRARQDHMSISQAQQSKLDSITARCASKKSLVAWLGDIVP